MKNYPRYVLISFIYLSSGILWFLLTLFLTKDLPRESILVTRIYFSSAGLFLFGSSMLIFFLIKKDYFKSINPEIDLYKNDIGYKRLFESYPIPMWVYDVETLKFLTVNNAAVKNYGYSKKEFLDMTLLDIRPKEEWDRLKKNIESVSEGLDLAGIWKHKKKDGSIIDVEIISHTFFINSRKTELVMATDISDRIISELKLINSEKYFQLALTSAGMGTWEVDLTEENGQVFWSKEYGRIFGRTSALFPKRAEDFYQLVYPEDRLLVKESFEAAIKNNSHYEAEFRILWLDGTVRWHSAMGHAIINKSGNPLRMIGVGRDVTEKKLGENRLKIQLLRMESLHSVDVSITNSLELRTTLDILVKAVMEHLGVNAADILLYKIPGNILEYVAGSGFYDNAMKKWQMKLNSGYAGKAAFERKSLFIKDLEAAGDTFTRNTLLQKEGFKSYAVVPLIAKGQLKGVLEVFHRTRLNPDNEWFEFLETLASQASIAIDNIQMLENLQRSNAEILMAYEETIEGWSYAMDLRDKETEGHTQRVTNITLTLARVMGIKEDEIVNIRRGALLHDIGKIGIPDNILLKPGKLTDEEWTIMRMHPQYAFDMLSRIDYLRPAIDVPYCHHEKWNGSGYPRKLKNDQIPLSARIFSVVDVWDALRSDRPYRESWPQEKVMDHINSLSGKDFDPEVVEIFQKIDFNTV